MAFTPSSSPPPNWLDLPQEVTSSILQRLGTIEILDHVQMVCVTWRNICKDPSMWRSIDMRDLNGDFDDDDDDVPFHYEALCRNAVDRSCGGLREIKLEYYTCDELLHYIADRAPQLRSLQLALCTEVSGEGLIEAVKKLPNLEELHIYSDSYTKDLLEMVGRHCPQLKSLTFNIESSHNYVDDHDGEALAIAQTMPGLRHLNLLGNKMTNVGLQAILSGCPHLESLDLRRCYFIDLGGNFGKTCAERIKYLKGPDDSTEGSEYDMDVDGESEDNLDEEDYYMDYDLYEPEPVLTVEELIAKGYTFGDDGMWDGDYDEGDGEVDYGQFGYCDCC